MNYNVNYKIYIHLINDLLIHHNNHIPISFQIAFQAAHKKQTMFVERRDYFIFLHIKKKRKKDVPLI